MLTKVAQSTEAFDRVMRNAIRYPDGRIEYRCSQHGYMWGDAVQTPQNSCEECWCMFGLKIEACTPPEQRREMWERLIAVMLEANRLAENGQWDVEWTAPQTSELILTDAD